MTGRRCEVTKEFNNDQGGEGIKAHGKRDKVAILDQYNKEIAYLTCRGDHRAPQFAMAR